MDSCPTATTPRSRVGRARRIAVAAALAVAVAGDAGAGQRVAGRILSVDAPEGDLVLDDAGHRHRVRLGPGTSVRERGTDKTVADLRKGDRVVVSTEGEPPVARRVEIAGPAPARADGAAAVPGFASGLDARTPPR